MYAVSGGNRITDSTREKALETNASMVVKNKVPRVRLKLKHTFEAVEPM